VGGISALECYDWSNGPRDHNFEARPNTEFNHVCFQCLMLQYEEPHSNLVFSFELRHCGTARIENWERQYNESFEKEQPGRAVQVEPMKPILKPPGTKCLKLTRDKLVSGFALKCNLRSYTPGRARPSSPGRRSPARRPRPLR